MNSKIEGCPARLEWWCPTVTSLFGRSAKILKRHLPLLGCPFSSMEIMDQKKLEFPQGYAAGRGKKLKPLGTVGEELVMSWRKIDS